MKAKRTVSETEYRTLWCMSHQSHWKLLRNVVSLASVLLFIHFCGTFAVTSLSIRVPFGLASRLPIEFWLGYALSLICVIVNIRHPSRKWGILSLLLLSLYQLNLTIFVEYIPQEPKTHSDALAELVLSYQHADPSVDYALYFPGAIYLIAALRLLTQLNPFLLTKLLTLVLNAMLILLAYVFFNKTLVNEGLRLAACALVICGAYMLSLLRFTSILGYLFYVMIFIVVVAHRTLVGNIMITLLFASTVLSHAYTPFVVVAALGLSAIAYRLASATGSDAKPFLLVKLLAVATLSTILIVYWVNIGGPVLHASLLAISEARTPEESLFANPTPYKLLYQASTLPYAVLYGIPLLIYLLSCRDRAKRDILLWVAGIALAATVSVGGYAPEFLPRAFLFGLLPLSYAVVKNHDGQNKIARSCVLIGILVISAGLHIPAQYGQESFFRISNSTIPGTQFLPVSVPDGWPADAPRFFIAYFFPGLQINATLYYVLDPQTANRILYRQGDQAMMELERSLLAPTWNRVYSSGDFWISVILTD